MWFSWRKERAAFPAQTPKKRAGMPPIQATHPKGRLAWCERRQCALEQAEEETSLLPGPCLPVSSGVGGGKKAEERISLCSCLLFPMYGAPSEPLVCSVFSGREDGGVPQLGKAVWGG